DRLAAAGHGLRDRHRHAAVLERPRGVEPLELQVHLAPGAARQVVGEQQRRAALPQRDHVHLRADRQPRPVLLDHAAPAARVARRTVSTLAGPRPRRPRHAARRIAHSPAIPSTRITLATSRTTSSLRRSSTVDASARSGAVCVTMTRLASSPRPSCRTVEMLTSWLANAVATAASTPGRSATSRLTWYRVRVWPIGRTHS